MERVPVIRRMIVARPSLISGCFWTTVAVAVPTGLRWLLDAGGTAGTPFVTFYPAILLAALFLGWRYGIATAVITGIVVNRFLRFEPLDFTIPSDVLAICLFAFTASILIYVSAMLRRLVQDQQLAAERETLLNQELLHRVKNMLATVSSIAAMTTRHSNPDNFIDAFNGRIAALSRATELLAVGKDIQCEIRKLVDMTIIPFGSGENFQTSGPDVELPRGSCVPLTLALHELCTNAVKYGALSVPGGTVALDWELLDDDRLIVRWREQGGPMVSAPTRKGMGSRLLRQQVGLAQVKHQFNPEGVACEIEVVRESITAP